MAVIPKYPAQGRVSPGQSPAVFGTTAGASPDAFGASDAAGKAGEALGALSNTIEESIKADQVLSVAREKPAVMQSLNDLEAKYAQDTNYEGMAKRWNADVRKLRDGLSERIGDSRVREAVTLHLDELAATKSSKINDLTFKLRRDAASADLDTNAETYAKTWAGLPAGSPERETLLRSARDELTGKASAGLISSEEAGKRARTLAERFDEADARRLMLEAPDQAVTALTDARNFPALGELKRLQLQDAATRRADASLKLRETADAKTSAREVGAAIVARVTRQGGTAATYPADLAAKITDEAALQKVDPALALTVAGLENSKGDPAAQPLDPRTKKPMSSALGVFQVTDGTWALRGGKPDERGDLGRQVQVGIANLAAERDYLKEKLGREPEQWEVYLGHQQGGEGARQLLTADRAAKASDIVGLTAVSNNGGRQDTTVGQFVDTWKTSYQKKSIGWGTSAAPNPGPADSEKKAPSFGTVPVYTADAEAEALNVARAHEADPTRLGLLEAHIKAKFGEGRRIETEAVRQTEREREKLVSTLSIAVSRGKSGYEDVEHAYALGWLKPHERTSLTKELDRTAADTADEAALSATVSAAFTGGQGTFLDFHDKKTRDAVDAHFADLSGREKWAEKPAAEQAALTVDYSRRVGMLPPSVRTQIQGSLRAGSADQKLQAADLLAKMESASPDVVNDISTEDRRMAELIKSYSGQGVTPANAVGKAEEVLRRPKAERDALGAQYAAAVKASPHDAYLKKEFSTGWSFTRNPEIPAAFVHEFDAAAGAEYAIHGNMDAARATALANMRRVWGVSHLSNLSGSPQVARLAPEKMYAVGDAPAAEQSTWQREQLLSDLAASGGMADPSKPMEGRVWLTPAPGKADPATGKPLYTVVLMHPNGVVDVVRQNDQPLLWRPDWAASPAGQRAAAGVQAGMDAARAWHGGTISPPELTAVDPSFGP